MLSHRSAAELWELIRVGDGIEVTVPGRRRVRRPRVTVHRRGRLGAGEITTHHRIPVTSPVRTILDIAPRSTPELLEAAINEADKLGLVDPETLRRAIEERQGQPGVAVVRELLDRRTFTLTDSELERRFLPLVRDAGLPPPLTQQWVNGYRVVRGGGDPRRGGAVAVA